MKFLAVSLLLVACLVGKGFSDTIQCYECDDCGDLSDSQLQSCPAEVTTTTTTTTTTNPSESTETSPTTLEDGETSLSTDQTPSSSSESSTSTNETTEQTPSSSSESIASTNEATEQTPSSSSESSTSTNEATEQTPASSSESSTSTTEPTLTTIDTEAGSVIDPNLQSEIQGSSPKVVQVIRNRRSYRSVLRAGPTYHCYSLDRADGDSQKVKKGCVEVPEDSTPCDVLQAEYGESVQNCKTCQSDGCNSSAALKFSLITFVIAIVIGVFCK